MAVKRLLVCLVLVVYLVCACGTPQPTPVLPTVTSVPPTATHVSPTATQILPTATLAEPTATAQPPTVTPEPTAANTSTSAPPTATPTDKPAPPAARVSLMDSGQRLGSSRSFDVSLGDLDGDGDLDAFITNDGQADGSNAVWLNNGGDQGGEPGTFTISEQNLGTGTSVELGDVDGDGDLDALVANFADVGTVWLNQGGIQGGTPGTFVDSGQRLGDAKCWDVELGDLDGDGDLDAFFANEQVDRVWLNDGNGAFTDSGQILREARTCNVELGDLDADGDLDAFVGGTHEPAGVWFNDGLGTFEKGGQGLTASHRPVHGLALGDIDGDGDLDAVVGIADQDPNDIWLNDGQGKFRGRAQKLHSSLVQGLTLGDLDGDGSLDVFMAMGEYVDSQDLVWLNDGEGSFVNSRLPLDGVYSSDAGLGDLDGDGDLDAFVVHGQLWRDSGGGLPNKVWLNETVPSTPVSTSPFPAIADLIAYIEDLASQDQFSGAVLIAQGGEPVFKGAYGLADRSSEIPNQIDTKFNLGSMNKMFTATAILQLAEQGKLSVDDKIIDHLPDYANQEVANQVTIHHLLTHTSGMGNVFTDEYDLMPKDQLMTPEDWLPLFVDTPLQFEPGAHFAYSNAGYVVLGLIIERITGQSYYDYIVENIYEPSGMLNSDSYDRDKQVPNLAIGYTTQGYEGDQLREPIPNTDHLPGRGFPAGGGYSTVEDLLKFRNALLSHQLLSPESTDLLITGKIELREGLQYAYGFFDKVVGDQRAVGHSGGFPGICDFMDIYLDLGYTVIMLSNSDEGCVPVLEFLREQLLEPAPTTTSVAARPPAEASLGDTWTRPVDDMAMVNVPAGTFEMGSLPDDDQFGPHAVTLDGFWIDQTEVTNAQFAAFLNDQGNQMEGGVTWLEVQQMENAQVEIRDDMFQPEVGKAEHPVVEVSWYGAAAYCEWVGGRLPTEAEWEYAARGPENSTYPWGNDAPSCALAQFGGCGDYSVPVGSLSSDGDSWVRAKAMAGNVWEWTADYYGEYPAEAQTNPTGPKSGERKVARGGSFFSAPDTLHTAYRYSSYLTGCVPNVGFRCAASIPGETSPSPATPVPQADGANNEYVPLFESDICHFSPPYGFEVECGYLIVPENRSKPDSASIRIHVAVFKSKNPDPKPDPVIYVAGGGGVNQLGSSEYYLINGGGNRILEDRDYIMYNQRGAYLNEPSMVCPDDTGLFWSLAKQDLTAHERADRKIEKRLECHDALLEQGIDLTAYNTVETAADVNDLRIALGYDKVNLYGTSSGTRTILTIMRNHPESIRSVILDSVYPPQVNLYSTYALSVHRVFSLLFKECAADPDCNQKYPNLEATFYQTVDDLNANPASVQLSRGTVLVDGGFFMEALYMNLYSTNSIPQIPSWIQAASQGHFTGLKNTFESLLSDLGTFMAMGFEWSMQCHEEVPFESYELGRELGADLPSPLAEYFDSYYEFRLCESWQSGQADPVENTAVVSDIPALVFAGQFDPITPPEWGLLAAETLSNHFFYESPGLGHGIMRSNECGLEIGLQFLEDPTSEPDASCLDGLTGPDFR